MMPLRAGVANETCNAQCTLKGQKSWPVGDGTRAITRLAMARDSLMSNPHKERPSVNLGVPMVSRTH